MTLVPQFPILRLLHSVGRSKRLWLQQCARKTWKQELESVQGYAGGRSRARVWSISSLLQVRTCMT